MNYIEIKTTFEEKNDAERLAELLLDKKLIACGQVFEIVSHYVWKKERFIEKEFMLMMKTKKSLFKQVEKEIKVNHPFEVAEIISLPIQNVSKEYADWIDENTI